MSTWRSRAAQFARVWPLLAIIACAVAAYSYGLSGYISLAHLEQDHQNLQFLVATYPITARLAYVLIYTVAVAIAIPGGLVLSASGGLLFGIFQGTVFALAGVTAGASILFLVAQSALRPIFIRRAGRVLAGVTRGLEKDGFKYMLALRLMPLMPFWLINIAAGISGIRFCYYVLATILGLAPVTAVFVSAGSALNQVLESGGHASVAGMLGPSVWLPLFGLALLALVPVGWRWRKVDTAVASKD